MFKNEVPGTVISFAATQADVAPDPCLQYGCQGGDWQVARFPLAGLGAYIRRHQIQIASRVWSAPLSVHLSSTWTKPHWLACVKKCKRH